MSRIKQRVCLSLIFLSLMLNGKLWAQVINGSGNVVTQTVTTSSVNALVFHPNMSNVEIVEGSVQSISLQGDDNILDSLEVYSSGDTLMVKFPTGNTYDTYSLSMTLTLPNIKSVDLFGLGDLAVNNFASASELSIRNHNDGHINVQEFANASSLEVINHAGGEITMNENFPMITNYTVYVHGNGNFYGCELDVDSCLVQNFGSGHAYVKANSFLNATIFGSGNIEYLGSPDLYTNNFGTGAIQINTSSACSGTGSGSGSSTGGCLDGDLNLISQSIALNTFEYLDLSVDVTTVEISEGTNQGITITGDSNVLEFIEFNLVGDTLFVESDSCFENHTVEIEIITPNFQGLNFQSLGHVTINDFANAEELILNNQSDGNITVGDYQTAYYLSVNNHGSGDITMTSDLTLITSYQVNNYGSGNYYGCQLDVASCYAVNGGSGLVSVGVSGYLNATVEGSGNIEYYSDPANVIETVTGSGQVLEGTDITCLGTPTGNNCIQGDGNVITQPVNSSAIEHWVIDVDFSSFLINQGSVQNISIQGDSNILDSLDYTVVGDTAYIQFLADTCFENYFLGLDITVPNLNSITFLRTGAAEVNDFSDMDSLTIINLGNVDVQLGEFSDLVYLNVENEGNGSVSLNEIQPNLNTMQITNTGSGGYFGCDQELDSCFAVNSGSGNIVVSVSEYLNATIEGSGHIEYYGNPFIESSVSGSGQIVQGSNEDCLDTDLSTHENGVHQFEFYPNPATNKIHFKHLPENSQIKIINTLGKSVLEYISNSTEIDLDISGLQNGTYILTVNNNSQILVKRP